MLFVAAPWPMSWRTVCLPWGVWCARQVSCILRPTARHAWASTRAVSFVAFMDSAMVRLETSSSLPPLPPPPRPALGRINVPPFSGPGALVAALALDRQNAVQGGRCDPSRWATAISFFIASVIEWPHTTSTGNAGAGRGPCRCRSCAPPAPHH